MTHAPPPTLFGAVAISVILLADAAVLVGLTRWLLSPYTC